MQMNLPKDGKGQWLAGRAAGHLQRQVCGPLLTRASECGLRLVWSEYRGSSLCDRTCVSVDTWNSFLLELRSVMLNKQRPSQCHRRGKPCKCFQGHLLAGGAGGGNGKPPRSTERSAGTARWKKERKKNSTSSTKRLSPQSK